MKKLALAAIIFIFPISVLAENVCVLASGYSSMPGCDSAGKLKVTGGPTIVKITVTPTVDTSAYAAGDAISTGLTFADAGATGVLTGRIREVVVSDASAQGVNLELNCSNIDAAASVDQAAFDPTDAQLSSFIKPIPIYIHTSFNDNGLSSSGDINVPYGPLASTSMDCFLVARGAPTYAAATDVSVTLTIERD